MRTTIYSKLSVHFLWLPRWHDDCIAHALSCSSFWFHCFFVDFVNLHTLIPVSYSPSTVWSLQNPLLAHCVLSHLPQLPAPVEKLTMATTDARSTCFFLRPSTCYNSNIKAWVELLAANRPNYRPVALEFCMRSERPYRSIELDLVVASNYDVLENCNLWQYLDCKEIEFEDCLYLELIRKMVCKGLKICLTQMTSHMAKVVCPQPLISASTWRIMAEKDQPKRVS